MSMYVRGGLAANADTLLHFPSDGLGGFTAQNMAASAANYTATSATVTGGGNVGTAGTRGYAFTQDGFYAPYTVTTGGVNGTIAVDIWRQGALNLIGDIPAAGGNLTLHTPCVLATYSESILESIVIRVNSTDTLTITDPAGVAIDTFQIAAAPPQANPIWETDGRKMKGPFGMKFATGTACALDIVFRPSKPTTDARLKPIY